MSDNDWAGTLIRCAIMKSMMKDEQGIHAPATIYLSTWMAEFFRDYLGECKTIPLPRSPNDRPKPEVDSVDQVYICRFDGVDIIENTLAYQPMVVGDRELVSPAKR